MRKNLLTLLSLLIVSVTAMAQERVVSGTIYDKDSKEALLQTTVQLLKADSSYVAGAVSAEDGTFKVTAPSDGKYIVKMTNIGYKNVYKNITIAEGKNVELGKINMATDAVMLKEVVAKGVAAKVVVKEDTFIYNASAYRTPEGSVVEELVKKIPGAQVDSEGNVTINGKTVKKVKVDGKEFLSGDTKTALKNLPTSIVDKVKAYDEKSDLARVSGIDDGEEETVLDFGIKKGMNRGYFGNVNLGYGTHKRYQENAMGMYTKDSFRMMGFVNANNTNDMGFPGGGPGGPGGFGGGRNGLNAAKMGMLNMNYEGSKLKFDLGIRWNHSNGDAYSKTSAENFISDKGSFSNSISQNYTRSNSWNIEGKLEWKPDSMTNIMVRPQYSYSTSDGLVTNKSGEYDDDPYKYVDDPLEAGFIVSGNDTINVNSNVSKSLSYGKNQSASGMVQYNRRLNSKGRNITLRVNANYKDGESNSISLQDLESRAAGLDDSYYRSTITNRYNTTPTKGYGYTLQATYSEPIAKKTYLQFRYRFKYSYSKSDRSTYSFRDLGNMTGSDLVYRGWESFLDKHVPDFYNYGNDETNPYYDSDLSKFSEYTTYTHIAEIMLRIVRSKYNFNVGAQLQPQRTHFVQDYQGVKADTVRNVTNFTPTVDFRYKISKVSQIRVEYRAETSQPSMSNLLNVVDDSNPQNISMGNPGLKPAFTNNLRAFYNGYRQSHMQSWMAHLNFSTTSNSISDMVTYYDKETSVVLNNRSFVVPAGGRVTRPENINGNWNASAAVMFNTSVDTLGNWNVNTFTNANYANNVGYVYLNNVSQKNTTKNLSLSERLSFSYRNDWLEVEPNGSFTYTHATNKLQASSNLDTWQFSYGLNVNITAPWGTSFNTGLTNNCRRGYNDSSMNTNELIWNAQISQGFLKGKPLTVMLQFYDILQNQSNFSRAISAMQRTDTEYNAINSYAMLKVTYRFNAFGGKEARKRMRGRGDRDNEDGPMGPPPGGDDRGRRMGPPPGGFGGGHGGRF